MKYLPITFLFCLLVFSCTNSKNSRADYTISVVENLKDPISLNSLFTEVEYVVLETTEESIFGNIDKLIYSEGQYYIMDGSRTKLIYVFSEEGQFLRTIGKIGKGPGEYSQIADFTIDEESNKVIILAHPSTVFVYDKDGDFLFKKDLFSGSLFSIINYNNGYMFSTDHNSYIKGENAYLFFNFDKEFNLLKKSQDVLSIPVNMLPLGSNSLLKNRDGISYFDFFTSTLHYNIDNKKPYSVFYDFKERAVPVEVYINSIDFFSRQREYGFISDAIFIDNLFLATFILSGNMNISIINIDTKYSELYKYKGWIPEFLYYQNGVLYSRMESKNIVEERVFFEEAKKITKYPINEDSNPVILKFKLSSFLNEF